jgi:predicted metalloprotease
VLVFLAIQLLGGGAGTGGGAGVDLPAGFDGGVGAPAAGPGDAIPADQDPDRDLRDFSAYVFTSAQESWQGVFERAGRPYRRAKLVLFRRGVDTGCGSASSAVGPFYCPADERVYLDLSFQGELGDRLGASGDFAWAYVIAHEVGHHVQRQLGTSDAVQEARREGGEEANQLSVRQELQADCYAGVWAHGVYRAGELEEGDVEEAVGAAEAVGDDRLQERATGSVDPDSFTHGTSAQRIRWFRAGYGSGEPGDCDTFSAGQV